MATQDYPGAAPFLPASRSLDAARFAVQSCRGCDLYRDATQAVFGDGPAGRLLDGALETAGVDRREVYLTNAVKHFRHAGTRGKQRLHKNTARWQVAAPPVCVATAHPSAVLRSRTRDADLEALVADLRVVARAASG